MPSMSFPKENKKKKYSDNIPEGYYLGRSKNRKEKSIELAPQK